MLTPEFFAAIGRLAFQFSRLEELVGLCIAELDPRNDSFLAKIWGTSFEARLELLKGELHRRVDENGFEFVALEQMCKEAITLARKRNDIMHGSLRFLPEFDWHFFNRKFRGSYSCDPTSIDKLQTDVEALARKFGGVRGECKSIRWAEKKKPQAK